jgi:hypothetical protein
MALLIYTNNMNIPNFVDVKVVDDKGYFTEEFRQIFSQMITQFQTNLSNEGYKIPSQTTDNIDNLDNMNSNYRLIIDRDTDELKINLNGTFKVIQTS